MAVYNSGRVGPQEPRKAGDSQVVALEGCTGPVPQTPAASNSLLHPFFISFSRILYFHYYYFSLFSFQGVFSLATRRQVGERSQRHEIPAAGTLKPDFMRVSDLIISI